MSEKKLNHKFSLPVEKIEQEIGMPINGVFEGYSQVVPLRSLKQLDGISLFKGDVFDRLIRRIPLRTDSEEKVYPYKDSNIKVFGIEPKGCEIGQKFILDKKVLSIMEDLEGRLFADFIVKGLSKMPPAQVYGRDSEDKRVIAFYVPPIVETHTGESVLIDGIHRSYICKSAGTTINAVHINNVKSFLPFDPIDWNKASLVSEKPPVNQRYQNLRPELFRDLSSVGIDG